ncbi:MAG: hypothetical protein IJY51_10015, partial [Treponema sp.]|uniref:hypothetical protein n=1 Tax=Treponema sp. TaxID=166 RepID=UPI00257BE944
KKRPLLVAKIMVESSFFNHLMPKETVWYSNGGKSDFYVVNNKVVIIDSGICRTNSKNLIDINYSLLTDKQNSYMKEFSEVYRFLKEDEESARDFLFSDKNKHSENPEKKKRKTKNGSKPRRFCRKFSSGILF